MLAALLTREHAPSLDAPVARALLMPNLQPPVTTGALAAAYRTRVLSALERINVHRTVADVATRGAEAAKAAPLKPLQFTPLMSLYLTDATTPQDIQEAKSVTKLGQKPSLLAWCHTHCY
jgi:dihydroorotase